MATTTAVNGTLNCGLPFIVRSHGCLNCKSLSTKWRNPTISCWVFGRGESLLVQPFSCWVFWSGERGKFTCDFSHFHHVLCLLKRLEKEISLCFLNFTEGLCFSWKLVNFGFHGNQSWFGVQLGLDQADAQIPESVWVRHLARHEFWKVMDSIR